MRVLDIPKHKWTCCFHPYLAPCCVSFSGGQNARAKWTIPVRAMLVFLQSMVGLAGLSSRIYTLPPRMKGQAPHGAAPCIGRAHNLPACHAVRFPEVQRPALAGCHPALHSLPVHISKASASLRHCPATFSWRATRGFWSCDSLGAQGCCLAIRLGKGRLWALLVCQ